MEDRRMSIAYIQVAFDLDEDCFPSHLDGKMRISVEDGVVSIHADKKNGYAYVLAEAPLADFQRAMQLLGVIEPCGEPAND
jgi:hypothetical protein